LVILGVSNSLKPSGSHSQQAYPAAALANSSALQCSSTGATIIAQDLGGSLRAAGDSWHWSFNGQQARHRKPALRNDDFCTGALDHIQEAQAFRLELACGNLLTSYHS